MKNNSTWRSLPVSALVVAVSLAGLSATAAIANTPLQTDFSQLEGSLEPGIDLEISFSIDPTGFDRVTWQVSPEGLCPPDFSAHENPGSDLIEVQCSFNLDLLDTPEQPPIDFDIYGYDSFGEQTILYQDTINLNIGGRFDQPFSDTSGTTHEASIEAIAQAGITGGFRDGTFRPNGTVTRGQMATFLTNALDLK